MLALCLMLSETYYAQNYAGIIGLGLLGSKDHYTHALKLPEVTLHIVSYSYVIYRAVDLFKQNYMYKSIYCNIGDYYGKVRENVAT